MVERKTGKGKKAGERQTPREERRAHPKLRTERRYRMVHYAGDPPDVYRAERVSSRIERMDRQALADLRGGDTLPSVGLNMRSIRSLLTEVTAQLKLHEDATSPELLARAWQKATGDFLATQAQLISLSAGKAVVSCRHPAVRFELQRNNRRLLAALNSVLGEGCVRQVIYR